MKSTATSAAPEDPPVPPTHTDSEGVWGLSLSAGASSCESHGSSGPGLISQASGGSRSRALPHNREVGGPPVALELPSSRQDVATCGLGSQQGQIPHSQSGWTG